MEWNLNHLQKLKDYHQEELERAEEEIETSSYPPDQQREIDINQRIVWLLRDMMQEKSWVYRLAHAPDPLPEG